MLVLLSPAKNLDLEPLARAVNATQPLLQGETKTLAKLAKTKSAADLKAMMHISDNLAALNAERFASFNMDGKSNSAKPAALTFNGDVYGGLDAKTLDDDALAYAQDHIRILSGLYGLLRPLDLIQPYRLEMGVKFENPKGANLYKFWGAKISDALNTQLRDHGQKTIVNLASNEYFKAVDKKALDAPIVSAKFLNVKDGKSKNISFYGKRARGLMARWIVDKRVDTPDQLSDFDSEGYQLDEAASSASELVFSRLQPPPAGSK